MEILLLIQHIALISELLSAMCVHPRLDAQPTQMLDMNIRGMNYEQLHTGTSISAKGYMRLIHTKPCKAENSITLNH